MTGPDSPRDLLVDRVPPRMLQWGMDAVYCAMVAVLPFYALSRVVFNQKTRSRWVAYLRDIPERFGRRHPRRSSGPCVWVHGVSVGEVKAAARLVEVIEESVPGVEVIVSVTTDTGRRVAQKRYPGRRIEFYPPDLSWVVDDALDALRPDLMILVESEFWPNFLIAAERRKIPVALVNGRMSERSATRFRVLRRIALPLLRSLASVCVQVAPYAERFASVGIDPDRIHVTGNMKFDNIPVQPDEDRQSRFARLFGVSDDEPTVVAGSTHPGEERALAGVYSRLRGEGLRFRLIIAPRHPGRADSVEGDLRELGLSVLRRSTMDADSKPGPGDVILLDTVGELEVVYSLADLVFVGGTLVPHGGQNVMEPASLGVPVVVGPYVHNFRGEVDMLKQADGLVLASDEAAVEDTLRTWLTNPDDARCAGRKARDVINDSKGATDRTLEILRPLLEDLRKRRPATGTGRPGP